MAPSTLDIQLLRENALALPHSLRAVLAQDLLKSLDQADEAREVEAAWADEAERRRADIKSGKVKCIPGAEVLRRARLRKK